MAGKQAETLSDELKLAQAENYFKDEALLMDPPVRRAAYSDRMAWILASMSQLVYDSFERDPQALDLLRAKLKSGGFELLATFNSIDTDTQAFLVANDKYKYAVLAFRGTEVTKKEEIKTDAKAIRVSTIEGRVHEGFWGSYQSIEKDVVARLTEKLKDYPLYITGHSLGAALATVATHSLELDPRFKNQIAACYTFGSPRVGDLNYDETFKSPIYRVVNTTDIVTVVPLLAMGYIHIGDIRFLERTPGRIKRNIPILQRAFFFLMAVLRLFGPLVGDHAITQYRNKLAVVAEQRNPRSSAPIISSK